MGRLREFAVNSYPSQEENLCQIHFILTEKAMFRAGFSVLGEESRVWCFLAVPRMVYDYPRFDAAQS